MIKVVKPSPELTPEEIALEKAKAALEAGIPAAARVLLEPFADITVRLETFVILGKTRFAQGDPEAALAILAEAEAMYPTDHTIWRTLAEIYAMRRQHEEEVSYRRKLVYLVAHPQAEDYMAWARAFITVATAKGQGSIQELEIAAEKLPHSLGITREIRLEFSELAYSIKKLSSQALETYKKLSPPSQTERDVSAAWLDLASWCESAQAPLHRCTVPGCGDKEVLLAELSQVIVLPALQWIPVLANGEVALQKFALHRVKARREEPTSPQLMSNARSVELRLQGSMRTIEQRALLVGGGSGYHDNAIGFLSALAIAETFQRGQDLPLVVNADLTPLQVEQLKLLGYSEDRLIRLKADEQACFSELIVTSRLVRGGDWVHPLVPKWYRSRLVGERGEPTSSQRRLYVSRRRASEGRITNEQELAQALSERGYLTVYPEDLGLREQIDLLAGATHVVVGAGTALTNMVFMPPGSTVIALTSRYAQESGRNIQFDALAKACGHQFTWLDGAAQEFHAEHLADADYEINIEQLIAALT